MNQWFFKISKYADELLDHSKIDWPSRINTMQTNWIGKSEGAEVTFDISNYGLEEQELRTFTTRIDTLFGVTFVVMAPEHPLVEKLTAPNKAKEVRAYINDSSRASEVERLSTERQGYFLEATAQTESMAEKFPY